VQPVLAVRDRDLADHRLDARIERCRDDGIRAARPPGAERPDPAGVDLRSGLEVGDRGSDVRDLGHRVEVGGIALGVAETAIVEGEHRETGGRQRLVVGLVQARVAEPQPSGTLHDRGQRRRLFRGSIGQLEGPCQTTAVAVERDLLDGHPTPLPVVRDLPVWYTFCAG
jgi:hypothetical protein